MARILRVDELHGWREIVRAALPDHRVDVVGSIEAAPGVLGDGGPYHVALVDLRVVGGRDVASTELLRLLHEEYPDTSVVVVASSPPSAAVRDELAARFGVEEILVAADVTVPDLRHTIEEALRRAVAVDGPIRRRELHRRTSEWRCRLGAKLDARVRAAEMVAGNAGGNRADFRRRAKTALADARELRERFHADSAALADRVDRAASVQEVLDAVDAVEEMESLYAGLVGP
jgi:DNA-binding NarL/FixJ family response regulator